MGVCAYYRQMIDEYFSWRTFDVTAFMRPGWDEQVLTVAREAATVRDLRPPHVTSREAPDIKPLTIRGVAADRVRDQLPWLEGLYRGLFRDLAQQGRSLPVVCAEGPRHTVVLNVQLGTDGRYETHIDTNPIQGLLYVTSQPPGAGGELVVSHNREARSVQDVDRDPIFIYPQKGHLIFFDARYYPHYIRPLVHDDDIRVAIAMNYYTPDCPERSLPEDLDDYLAGQVPRVT